MSAQMLASNVAAKAVAAPRFGKKASGISARKAISKAPIGGHQVKAAPKAAFSVSASAKKTCIVTGASSGLGLYTTKALVDQGDYHVIMAVRNVAKAEEAANELGLDKNSYTVMELELGDLASVRNFVKKFRASKLSKNFQSLICNAAIYFPNATKPTYTKDGFEETVGVTHLGHFLLSNLLLNDLAAAPDLGIDKRMVIVGSVTANTNTLAGQVPPRANLGTMSGLAAGLNGDTNKDAMIDGDRFIGPKAYKDAKLCNILTIKEMNARWHEETGITFSTMYPGCIADTPLFRNHTPTFRFLFPLIQKYITKGYVTMSEAGGRLASIACDPDYTESGAYWAWKGGGDQLWDNYWDNDNREKAFNNKTSKEGGDMLKAKEMFDMSAKVVGLKDFEIGPKPVSKMPSMPSMPNPLKMMGAK